MGEFMCEDEDVCHCSKFNLETAASGVCVCVFRRVCVCEIPDQLRCSGLLKSVKVGTSWLKLVLILTWSSGRFMGLLSLICHLSLMCL